MQKYFYPIFKLPDFYVRDYQKQELPLWVKWWLLGKAGRKLSEILTGSEFTLLNTVARKFKIFELSGRTEQEQLTGKNLFELTTPTISEGTKVGDLANGYWYKGNTSSSTGEYANSKGWLTLPFTFEANENHVLSFNVKQIRAGYTNKIALRYEDTATNLLEITLTNISTRYNVLLNPSVNKRVYIALSSNEIQLTDIQVEQGSTATSYEPYCGGIPSPNPDFPQQIKNVTGNANVKIQNKNLINYKTVEATYNTTVQLIENGFKATGSYAGKIVVENLKPNTNYCLNYDKKNITGSGKATIIYAGTAQSVQIASSSSTPFTFNTRENTTINIWFYTGNGEADFTNIQLEEGSTATDFVPHQEQNYPFTFASGQRLMEDGSLQDNGINNKRKQKILLNPPATNADNSTILSVYWLVNYCPNFNIDTFKKCSHFKEIKKWSSSLISEGKTCLWAHEGITFGIIFNKQETGVTTLAEAKTFLAEHNIIVEWELAEEEIIPYNETQEAQYNAIKNAYTYKDITYISGSSDELAPELKIQYWKERGTE